MSTILVTGGAGYIGCHVVKGLLRQGHQSIIYDNLQTGHRKVAKDALFIHGDLADSERLRQTFQSYSIQAVIHFDADCLVIESGDNPLKYFNNNVKNKIQLI
jgi:UDP-glucose 4-epimerase